MGQTSSVKMSADDLFQKIATTLELEGRLPFLEVADFWKKQCLTFGSQGYRIRLEVLAKTAASIFHSITAAVTLLRNPRRLNNHFDPVASVSVGINQIQTGSRALSSQIGNVVAPSEGVHAADVHMSVKLRKVVNGGDNSFKNRTSGRNEILG